MNVRLDHLVLSARTLEEGVAWVESRLGVAMGPGGKHATMGTHNRLLSLGPGRFLEVIAVDPAAPPPGRARWFAMDTAERARVLAKGPALVHWVARTDDLANTLALLDIDMRVLDLARGEYRWKIGVPDDGALLEGGAFPTLIQWQGKHPSDALPDSGCALESLTLRHPSAGEILGDLVRAGLSRDEPLRAEASGSGLAARIATPRGAVALGE